MKNERGLVIFFSLVLLFVFLVSFVIGVPCIGSACTSSYACGSSCCGGHDTYTCVGGYSCGSDCCGGTDPPYTCTGGYNCGTDCCGGTDVYSCTGGYACGSDCCSWQTEFYCAEYSYYGACTSGFNHDVCTGGYSCGSNCCGGTDVYSCTGGYNCGTDCCGGTDPSYTCTQGYNCGTDCCWGTNTYTCTQGYFCGSNCCGGYSPVPPGCGVTTAFCGDYSCDFGEDCSSCPSDCGVCPPNCGDGSCDIGEDCFNCEADCGICPLNICTSFTYSDWSSCVNGQQTRTVLTQSPLNCTGGNPILNQTCKTPLCPPECLDGCCNPDGSCTDPKYTNDANCLQDATLTYTCSDSIHKALNFAKYNLTKNTLSCVWETSCEIIPSDSSDVEYCDNGCASGESNCLHKYCLDSDSDGAANNSNCVLNPTPVIDKIRTDYQYVLFSNSKTWQGAKDDCVNLGGDLVQIVDSEVKQILEDKFSGREYWIGFNDNVNEGKFVWPRGNIGEVSAYSWDLNQPDNNGFFGAEEDCAIVQSDGTWNDVSCNSNKNYVCELPYVFDCDDNNPSVSASCVSAGNASWTNLVTKNTELPSADPSDTVLMVSNVSQGGLKYQVKTSGWFGDPVLFTSDNAGSFSPYTLGDNSDNFFFTVTDSSGSSWDSEVLQITNIEDNYIPFVSILSPQDKTNSVSGGAILFNATVYDEDDFLKVTWDFGDGQGKTFDNYAQAVNGSSVLSTSHTYDSCGLFNIKLTAEEVNRDQTFEDWHELYIYKEGICVFPVISSPENKRKDYASLVLFNATQSYVTNCSATTRTDEDFKVGSLSCHYVHKPGQKTLGAGYSLFAEWIVDNTNRVSGVWNSEVSGMRIQEFYRWFGVRSYHVAQLKLTFYTI